MQKTPSLTLPRKREREFFQKHGGIFMVLKVNWYGCFWQDSQPSIREKSLLSE